MRRDKRIFIVAIFISLFSLFLLKYNDKTSVHVEPETKVLLVKDNPISINRTNSFGNSKDESPVLREIPTSTPRLSVSRFYSTLAGAFRNKTQETARSGYFRETARQSQAARQFSTQLSVKLTHVPQSNKPNENLCLKLAPKVYIKNEAKTFTAADLNVTQYEGRDPLIPKIIHQTWDTYNIPKPAVPYVKTVIQNHPDWEYWFWTAEERDCYMKTHYPEYMDLYWDYPETIFRTDVIRYFLLYDYGGFYLDLDIDCLKPLDIWAHISSSILSHETYEHTFFGHLRKQPNVMTTVLATKPKHPYYKLLQENLRKYHNVCPKNVLYSTGPFYIDNIYQLYVQRNETKLEDDITIIHPRYWLPTFTSGQERKIRAQCNPRMSQSTLTQHQKELCQVAVDRNFKNAPFEDSYLNHHWANTNVKGSKFLTKDTVSLLDLVPNLRKVKDILNLNCA